MKLKMEDQVDEFCINDSLLLILSLLNAIQILDIEMNWWE